MICADGLSRRPRGDVRRLPPGPPSTVAAAIPAAAPLPPVAPSRFGVALRVLPPGRASGPGSHCQGLKQFWACAVVVTPYVRQGHHTSETSGVSDDDRRAPYDPMPHGPEEVGVGPWQGPWPSGRGAEVYDEELLREGDRRNVVDRYRYWRMEAIVADLDTRRHDFHVAIENWQHDFNIGTIVRSANAFLAAEVHIVGNRRWNRRGAMVTDRYQHVRHHATPADLAAYLHDPGEGESVRLLGIDNLPGSAHLETMAIPRRVCFLFGQEGPGLSDAAREICDGTFSIAQFGST